MEKTNQELESVIEKLEAKNKQLEAKVEKLVDEAKAESIKAKAKVEKGQISIISIRKLNLNGKSLQNKDVVKMPNNANTKRAVELGLIKIIG